MTIYAASCDTPDTNARFAVEGRYPWTILSDPTKRLATALGVIGVAGFPHRWTYFIDDQGMVRQIDKSVKPVDYGKTLFQQLTDLHVPKQPASTE